MSTDVYYITAEELAALGKDQVPDELQSSKHLIYSSPADAGVQLAGSPGLWREAGGTGDSRFGDASGGARLLRAEYHDAQ